MTTAPHTFRRQVAEKKAKAPRPAIEFMIEHDVEVEEGEEIPADQFHATMPTDERLFILMALAGDDEATPATEAATTLDFFRDSLPEQEFRLLKRRLGNPQDAVVDLSLLQEILMWMIGEWSTFPTEPPSDSLESPPSTGARSTGRVRGQGSTHSTSR